jgi:hypothetical protein
MPRIARFALAALCLIAPATGSAADTAIRVELNTAETVEKRCRLSFVVENKGPAIKSFRLDLVLFNGDGVIHHRMLTEMGPVRANKTVVRTFSLDGDCARIGSVLVNDVACTPGTPDTCLDGLTLESRLRNVRLYK